MAEGNQTLLANYKPAWYKVSTLDELSFDMSKDLIIQVQLNNVHGNYFDIKKSFLNINNF